MNPRMSDIAILPVPTQAWESKELGLRLLTTAGKPTKGASPAAAVTPPKKLRLLVFMVFLDS
jgi:hypothetical protein